ncbi:MAG: hypothetical protein E7646_01195 [Ruminococcaceae bacterium]|nr:hypothetical protein [Oscillospiraceae bacterium]
MKKFIALILCVMAVLCSCTAADPTGTATPPQNNNGTQDQSSSAPKVPDIYLFKDGECTTDIIVNTKVQWQEEKAANEFMSALAKKVKGTRLSLKFDVMNKTPGKTEIIIGNTSRELSKELYSKLDMFQVGVIIKDGCIAIGAGIEENLPIACNWFRKNYMTSVKSGTLAVPGELEYIADAEMAIIDIPAFETPTDEDPRVTDCGDGYYLMSYLHTEKADVDAYAQKLTSQGYTLHSSNTIGNNSFAKYIKDNVEIHITHHSDWGQTKIVFGEYTSLLPQEPQVVDTTKTNDVYMLETKNFGLSMVIQLKDGSFIIIDGAQTSESANLVKFLQSLTPEGQKPHVAAWIMTHAHPDHSYALYGLSSIGKTSAITVDRFIFNFPSDSIYEQFEPDCIGQTKNVRNTIKGFYESSEVIKPHTGDTMYLGDIKVEFLCSQEDVIPNNFNDFNDSSLLMKFYIDGQILLVSGDMSVGEFNYCNDAYDESVLKCDIFQLPHHGYNVDMTFFNMLKPKISLLPENTEDGCNSRVNNSVNKILIDSSSAWYGSYKTVKIQMPFTSDDPGEFTWEAQF